ncbi:secreted frizzled-related protein 2-like [Protopterus annectens]|uniref:secreted frizzled-related protein 2-like n=1 Tax=Protopterus annectens TaxID=7888 RepID=UPI001CFA8884|nr:secreted frizzled-related protein 2-like [Protopterus annectens]
MDVQSYFSFLVACFAILAQAASFSYVSPEIRSRRSSCKPIPTNLVLCHRVGYNEMRLPNLLGHDSMKEILQQASSWVPLVNKQCNQDTKKFLCSLFAPVCLSELEGPIYPCRTLCEAVKADCEPVMSAFGFPWPEMFNCSHFPGGGELCVPPAGAQDQSPTEKEEPNVCDACQQKGDSEKAILGNFCTDDFVLKMRVKELTHVNGERRIIPDVKNKAIYKHKSLTEVEVKDTVLWMPGEEQCICKDVSDLTATLLATGHKVENRLMISLVTRWRSTGRELKKFTRTLKRLKC